MVHKIQVPVLCCDLLYAFVGNVSFPLQKYYFSLFLLAFALTFLNTFCSPIYAPVPIPQLLEMLLRTSVSGNETQYQSIVISLSSISKN